MAFWFVLFFWFRPFQNVHRVFVRVLDLGYCKKAKSFVVLSSPTPLNKRMCPFSVGSVDYTKARANTKREGTVLKLDFADPPS